MNDENARKTILAVDDEQDIIDMLVLLLESEGYRILSAPGGAEAIALLEEQTPDLVLLDIMMPEVDGHKVCKHIRAQERLSAMPVLMLTAKNDIAHIAQAVDEGADGFIVKPFDVDQFLRVLQFRLAGEHAEFYRSERPVLEMTAESEEQLADKDRIVFVDIMEPDKAFSVVVHACEGQSHVLLSLWQHTAEDDDENGVVETTALLGVDSSAQFGLLLNRILDTPEVRVMNCVIFRDFAEIPFDIMHRGE